MNHRFKSAACAMFALLSLASLSACENHERPAPIAPEPPPTAQVEPAPPPAPTPDEILHGALARIGGAQTDRGWTVPLPGAKFSSGKVTLDPADGALMNQIANLVKSSPTIRILVAVSEDDHGPRTQRHRVAQLHAEEVRAALSAEGADEGRIQAQGSGDQSPSQASAGRHQSTVVIIISNAAGEFPAAPPGEA